MSAAQEITQSRYFGGEAPAERAKRIAPIIAASASQIERDRALPKELLDALHGAALFRTLLPRAFRGEEVPLHDFVQMQIVIASVDASTAWCVGQASGCSMAAAYLKPEIAYEIWGADPRAVLAWGMGPQSRAVVVDGGYRVTGRKIWTSSGQVANKIVLLTRTTPKDQCARPTDGMTLFYTDLDHSKIEVRRIPKMGRNAVDSNATFIDDYFIPDADRIGEEGKGFHYILHSLNPERILVGIEAVGLGQGALARAVQYAGEREVFGRLIGSNQGIQHPLAENWMYLESAFWMLMRASYLYDAGQSCGAEANAGKFLAARAAFDACTRAVMTHGGMGYSTEYQVERLFRESILLRIAPITEQMICNFIGEKVLGLPKTY